MNLPIENQVASLELSKRLAELGVPQKSLFYWVLGEGNRGINIHLNGWSIKYGEPVFSNERYSSFTTGELLELVKSKVRIEVSQYRDNDNQVIKWWVVEKHNGQVFIGDILVNVVAEMLIYLIEQRLVKVGDL